MKHDYRFLRFVAVGAFLVCCAWLAFSASATTESNPYAAIVSRNVFALKPPTPLDTTPPPDIPPPSDVEFRGTTTLLGRPQALINIKVKGKPPEGASDRSLVMDIGQREGDVELLSIDMPGGAVRLRVQGREVSMNLKDNAPKPQATAAPAVAAPGVNPVAKPALPVPGAPAARAGTSMSTFGGNNTANSARPVSLPSRSLRGNNTTPGYRGAANSAPINTMTPEEKFALVEIERERTKEAVDAGELPPLPPITYPDR